MKRFTQWLKLGALIAMNACSGGNGGCSGNLTSNNTRLSQQMHSESIQYNGLQAKVTPQGFAFINQEIANLIESALQKPLTFQLPEFGFDLNVVKAQFCKKTGSKEDQERCLAQIKLSNVKIERLGSSTDTVADLKIEADMELTIPRLYTYQVTAADRAATPLVARNCPDERCDCQIDVTFKNRFRDICQSPGQSWWQAGYDVSDNCRDYCTTENQNRPRTVEITLSVSTSPEQVHGHPSLQIKDIQFKLNRISGCAVGNDIKIYNPKRNVIAVGDPAMPNFLPMPACQDGSQDCLNYWRSMVMSADEICGALPNLYPVLEGVLSDFMLSISRYAINDQLSQILSIPCQTAATDCPYGEGYCGIDPQVTGFPEACTGSDCLLKPSARAVCLLKDKTGKPKAVPPLLGVTMKQSLAQDSGLYQPDTQSSQLRLMSGAGGLMRIESDDDLSRKLAGIDDTILTQSEAQKNAARGLYVGAISAIESDHSTCVPLIAPPPFTAKLPRLELRDQIELFSYGPQKNSLENYHVSAVIHQEVLDRAAHALFNHGSLCLALDNKSIAGATGFGLTTGQLSLLGLSSLSQLARVEGSAPITLYIQPEEPPVISIGKGALDSTSTPNKLEAPHLELSMQKLNIDMYAKINGRDVKLMRIRVSFKVAAFLELDAHNQLMIVTNPATTWFGPFEISKTELMNENNSAISTILGDVIGSIALPLISKSLLSAIPLPEFTFLPGYQADIVGVRGLQPLTDEQTTPLMAQRYAYLGIFGRFKTTPYALSAPTRALATPPTLSLTAIEYSKSHAPQAQVAIAPLGQTEYSHRLDNGMWSLFSDQTALTFSQASLMLPGTHTLEVRARTKGAPDTLSTPSRLDFTIEESKIAPFALSLQGQTEPKANAQEVGAAAGCHNAPHSDLSIACLFLMASLRVARRVVRKFRPSHSL